MTILGGTNCGCYPDADCSVPVFSCRECGDSDYGDNEIARLHKSLCPYREECETKAFDYASLPPLYLTKREFNALPEYSATHPTGERPGVRWRRHDGAFDRKCEKPVWIIGEYAPLFGRDDCLVIKWHIPVLKIDAPLDGGAT
ncbi:hypothetical protein [Rhizobium sp. SSA_523]|uniref:hypothetical protein n=1 Tax=Rhizobium sp. SSA_523 TaxID=2952477 RepID=UPI00209087BA|nr:hypothetical protein [Rhizobium sp. SSA_523]MCO5730153.1 hypothetical protein [Rhizobium sp. SSA_523]WKC25218.1 hypothetical protein QTJ18_14625 [Rhizobium sp. SSA_523]